jgi:hypothetical protein
MKSLTHSILMLLAFTTLSSAFADQDTPQPCDANWNACAIGRADPFDIPSTGDTKGRFLIDVLYATHDQISNGVPLIGSGKLGSEVNASYAFRAYVAPGAVDVVLHVSPTAFYTIGKLSGPIGTDVSTYYTREIKLNDGVEITVDATKTEQRKYCDPGGMFGAVVYNQEFNTNTYTIQGVTPQPITHTVTRMVIKSSHISIFGCKKP